MIVDIKISSVHNAISGEEVLEGNGRRPPDPFEEVRFLHPRGEVSIDFLAESAAVVKDRHTVLKKG
jgi:hypothetical protein